MKKEKTRSYQFTCSLDLIPFEIYFSLGETDEKFKKGVKKYLFKEDYKTFKKDNPNVFKMKDTQEGWCCHNFKTGHTIIRVKKYETAYNMGTLSHEIKHAVDNILWHDLGMKPRKNNEELFAYAIGYITKKCFENIYIK